MPGITGQLTTAVADRYKIEKHVGEGGMATVYLAHDLKHDRKVALKVLRPELAAVIGAERFLNEIKVTANLQHPHILPLHDSGSADGFLFYVMPFIEDDTLRDKLDREKQFGIDDAVEITRSIASALDYAHRQGVIHRDIKPANILMHEGQPMIADFGIALAVSEASDQRLTETGLSIGTPHYMSPEQAMGDRELDARSDVYSLGAMLYEMLAGEPPYSGSTAQAIVAKVITSKPNPIREARETVPLHVEAAVAKSLHKSPADRFNSASAFADALADPGFTVPTTVAMPAATDSAPAPARGLMGVLAASVLVALAGGLVVGRLTSPTPASMIARFTTAPPEGVTPASMCCGPTEALSPDGEWLVFIGIGGDGSPLYRRRLGQLEAEPIPGTAGAAIPFFSHDGQWVGFTESGRLRKVPMAGGPPVTIADIGRVEGASWGDNDVIVLSQNDGPLYTIPASGASAPVAVPGTEGGGYIHPWMLPGGEAAVSRMTGAGSNQDARVAVVDLATGKADTLGFATMVRYASGYLVMSGADGSLLAQPFDAEKREPTGQAVALLDGLRLSGPAIGEYTVSNQGSLVFQGGSAEDSEERLVILAPTGAVEVPLSQPGNLEHPAFSPDGRRVVVQIDNEQLWIWDRDQQTQRLLTVDGEFNISPVWTPDGQRIAYASGREDGPIAIYWQAADGSDVAGVLFAEDSVPVYPKSFSNDGNELLITGRRSIPGQNEVASFDIGILTIADGTVRWLVETPAAEGQPTFSPDGVWFAYTSNRSGQREVYVQALDGTSGQTQVSAGGGHSPRWLPDQSAIYFATEVGLPMMAASVTVEGGSMRVTQRTDAFSGPTDHNAGGSTNWDANSSADEFVYVVQGASEGGSGFTWILNWPQIVREMTGGN